MSPEWERLDVEACAIGAHRRARMAEGEMSWDEFLDSCRREREIGERMLKIATFTRTELLESWFLGDVPRLYSPNDSEDPDPAISKSGS